MCATVDVLAERFGEKTQQSGPAYEEQPCPSLVESPTRDLTDDFPLKSGDLIYSPQLSLLASVWPPLPHPSTQKEVSVALSPHKPYLHTIESAPCLQGLNLTVRLIAP